MAVGCDVRRQLPLGLLFGLALLLASCSDAQQHTLSDSDLVLVRASCGKRLQLAHATGRAARTTTALRTVYVLDSEELAKQMHQEYGDSMNETYLHWPDRPDPKKPGDTRVALAPWLAHKALGATYKWFLYGDDDTFFFVDSVKRLLRDYDPNLPYVVTDALWHKRKRYLMDTPRCLPCHVSPAYVAALAARPNVAAPKPRPGQKVTVHHQPPVPPVGCPCTPELACEFTLNVTGQRKALQGSKPKAWSPESRFWGFPSGYPTKCDYPHFHGGSGVLISVGAMRKVSYEAALRCSYDDTEHLTAKPGSLKDSAHGDRMTSLCFWMNGIAITDPGLSIRMHETTNVAWRVMDSRTANVEVLREAIKKKLPPIWLWPILTMAAAHVGHHDDAISLSHELSDLYPRAFKAAEEELKRLGQWGRSDLDAQEVKEGLSWGKKGWQMEVGSDAPR